MDLTMGFIKGHIQKQSMVTTKHTNIPILFFVDIMEISTFHDQIDAITEVKNLSTHDPSQLWLRSIPQNDTSIHISNP